MRKDGIPYVPNPKGYYPPIDINKLTLDELKQKYLKNCGKSNGNLSNCSKCKNPCAEGKRAMQLLANEVYNNPPVPLYGGKTLIERAKEENAKRRAEEAEKEANVLKAEKENPKKRKYQKMDDWWEKSLEAEDQVEWIVDKFGISKTQAKKKIYSYRYTHGLTGTAEKEGPTVKTVKEEKTEVKEEVKEDIVEKTRITKNGNDIVFMTMESKIDELMKLQADYKQKVDEYQKKYQEVSDQIDVLCKAMDVFDVTNG